MVLSIVDLAADCVYWLSGQALERPADDTYKGIAYFGTKNEPWSLQVLQNFCECLLECLKSFVLPESNEIVENARGFSGSLFGVSQEGLKQTQRAAEKLTTLTLREAMAFEPAVVTSGLDGVSGAVEDGDSDSDDSLLMSD